MAPATAPRTPTFVYVTNEGSTDFKDQYDSERWVIAPGQTIGVSYDAICLWLGHPQANNIDPRNRVRQQEYERIRTRYGVDARALEMSDRGEPIDTDSLFLTMRPQLVVKDTEGKVIVTVSDDPDGTTLTPEIDAGPNADIQTQLLARLQQLENEQRALKSELAQRNRTEQALNDAVPVDEDHNPDAPPAKSPFVGAVDEAPRGDEDDGNAPRPPARTTVGEDSPQGKRIRVTQ